MIGPYKLQKMPVTFLTYKRPEYLEKTLTSFFELNASISDLFVPMILVQDADEVTEEVVSKFPFEKIIRIKNIGCSRGYAEIMAKTYDFPYSIHIQDDWESRESLAPYIDNLVEGLNTCGYIRLRARKERVNNKNRLTRIGIKYRPINEHVFKSNAHFSLNPMLIRTSVVQAMIPFVKEKHGMMKYQALQLPAGQLKGNVFFHIGTERAVTYLTDGRKRWVK